MIHLAVNHFVCHNQTLVVRFQLLSIDYLIGLFIFLLLIKFLVDKMIESEFSQPNVVMVENFRSTF